MAIKRIELPSTGIFQRKETHAELRADDPQSWEDDVVGFLGQLTSEQSQGPLAELTRLEADANNFLNEYIQSDMGGFTERTQVEAASAGIDYVVEDHLRVARQNILRELETGVSQEKKRALIKTLTRAEKASDACLMLHCISVIRSQLKIGAAEQAVAHGITLGRAAERFRVRDSEPKAWTGGIVLQAAASGGKMRRVEQQQYQRIVSDFRASGLSQRRFAQMERISRSKLERALKAVKKLDSTPGK